MWASRALLIHRVSVFSSSSLSTSWHTISHAFPYSPSASKAHHLLQYRCVVYNKITKNKLLLTKTRDSSYENFMDDEKKLLILRRIIKLLLKQPGKKMLYRFMLRRGGYVGLVKPQKMGHILDKYPRIVRVYRNPNELDVWVTLAKPTLELLEEEKMLKQEGSQLAAERLRKVLMMSTTRRIRLDRINYLKEELGLPDDFKKTVVKANPHLFKLVITRVNLEKGVSPSVKLLEWDEKLTVPTIEAYREDPATTSGLDEEEKQKKAYSFPINLPPSFKIKKAFRYKMRKWQELPYRSPYEDTSDLDLKSEEAFKRAVAVIHEFLHITVEKRTRIDRLAHLREEYKLPQKLGITVLHNPGIFYMSIKSNTQTIFLREGYKKGELLEKDRLFTIKEKFLALIRMGRKSVNKTNHGPRAISDSDSDTSEEETEMAAMCKGMEIGEVKEVEGLAEHGSSKEEEDDDPPATIQMVDPLRSGMDAATTERSMEDSDPHKFLLSASRFLHGANDDDQLQSELIEGEVSPSEQKEGEASGLHTQFTQAIQDLLQPRYPADYPFQAAHSRVFMSTAMPCEMCKVMIKEMVNVLVCDTCEKVFHLHCLQSYLLTGIPKGDWHCPKCSEESKEKNQAPKYGRVNAGFSFSDASGIMGKSSTKGLPNAQKAKQPASSADGKSTKEARDKVAPATRKLDDAVPDSSKASQKILNHGNLGGSFTALLDSFAQGEGRNSANLLKGGRPANHTPSPHPQTTTRSAFLRSQAGESPTMVPSKPQSHGERGTAKVAGEGMQAKKTAEIQSASSLSPDPNGAGNGGKQSNSVEEALWEETSSGAKWVRVNWCYYPAHMAMLPGRPPNLEVHEVYESNHGDNNLVGTIQGQCLVLQPESYAKEMEKTTRAFERRKFRRGPRPNFSLQVAY